MWQFPMMKPKGLYEDSGSMLDMKNYSKETSFLSKACSHGHFVIAAQNGLIHCIARGVY